MELPENDIIIPPVSEVTWLVYKRTLIIDFERLQTSIPYMPSYNLYFTALFLRKFCLTLKGSCFEKKKRTGMHSSRMRTGRS